MRIRLDSIDRKFEKEPFIESEYSNLIDDFLVVIYNVLITEKHFMDIVKCDDNSKDDVFKMFEEKVDEAIIINFADFDNTNHLIVYNLMTDDKHFFKEWKYDLFELIYQEFHQDE